MAGKSNIRIITDEVKLSGLLNAEEIDNGIIKLEADGSEIDIAQYLKSFDGVDVELSIKKKVETPVYILLNKI